MSEATEVRVYEPSAELVRNAAVSGMDAYKALCAEAERDYEGYWARLAREHVTWQTPFTRTLNEDNRPFFKWFEDGKLNVSYNCLDRNIQAGLGDKTAIIFEADDGTVTRVSYSELLVRVSRLANALDVLREAQAQLQDAAHSLNGVLNHTELDPQRLQELDQRMSAWMALARRHRRPANELPALLQGWQTELAELDAATDLAALEHAAERAHSAWLKVAQTASRQRKQAAPKLAAAVTDAMQELGMAGGRFEVALTAIDEPQAGGLESIEFLVAGHAGSTPRPLGKVASGGELSRLALAIAVTASQQAEVSQVATLIFDEIDSGVGGAVADTVGRLMQRLGEAQPKRQVLAVTHLAQVAACAHHHLVVSKSMQAGQTSSDIREVGDEARVLEVARMLGGSLTDTSRAHAQSMLAAAQASPSRTRTAGRREPA